MPEQEEMDRLLRGSLGAVPAPQLSATFESRLAKRLRPRRLSAGRRWAMGLYALLALIVCVWVMRGAAIGWLPIAIAILAPLLLAAGVQYRQHGVSS